MDAEALVERLAAWRGKYPILSIEDGLRKHPDLFRQYFGTVIPMGLQWLKQDPALSSGIWLTTTTDVLGFLVYLGAATLLISRLQ